MEELKNIEPNNVFKNFELISKIPRCSGNTKKISEYIVSWAKEKKLEVYSDNANNVVVRKESKNKYKNVPSIILQGHIDMVCQKDVNITGSYPGWEYSKKSILRDICIKAYEKLYGNEPKVDVVHAGLECGLFYKKIENFDCISMGPNLLNVHTSKEAMQISSVQNTYKLLIKILEEIIT